MPFGEVSDVLRMPVSTGRSKGPASKDPHKMIMLLDGCDEHGKR